MSETDSEREFHSVDEQDELDGFIVSDEEDNAQQEPVEIPNQNTPSHDDNSTPVEHDHRDRLREMNSILKPNETPTQKLLRAHISVLVSALGGVDYSSTKTPAPYKLGHDALACLKDIKRWIQTVDQRTQSFDVAIACADSGLLINDLTVMLCQWDTQLSKKEPIRNAKITEKIMLANLELMTQLTWPFELNEESSESQRLSFSNIKKIQVLYKKHILHYNKGQTLKAVLRLALETMKKDKSDWEPRDDAILSLVLSFIRNVLYIAPINSSISLKARKEMANLENMPAGVTKEDISMNVVLNCFKRNKVLMFLLTIASSVGTDFNRDMFGSPCLECIHLLVKDVDPQHLINSTIRKKLASDIPSNSSGTMEAQIEDTNVVQPIASASGMQLDDLLKAEVKKKRHLTQNLSTRHGRFGTLLSIQGYDQSYVVSGQQALPSASTTMDKLDKSKTWSKPKSFRYDSDLYVKDESLYLNSSALLVLKEFINQFLVGDCFNNLIANVSKLITSDDIKLIDLRDKANYFLTIAWFLRYKRERAEYFKLHPTEEERVSNDDSEDSVDFSTIKEALSEINFLLILNYFRLSSAAKDWNSIHVAMVVFLELLLISHTLFISTPDEQSEEEVTPKDLGEGVIRNLFTSYDFLNILVQLPQSASKHSPLYLKTCINTVHTLLKAFEAFTKENVKLYIQRRRKKIRSKPSSVNDVESRLSARLGDLMDYSDEEVDNERAKEETYDRELDLKKTEIRFFHQETITSYIDFLSEYEDLSHEDIKKCLSYFHRLFVVRKDYTGLYRLDFMYIIHKLRDFLPRSSSIRNHVDEFIVYFMRKFKPAFARFPNPIELLFPRFEDSQFISFLASGEISQKVESSSQPRLAKLIDFIKDFTLDEKVKLLISALFSQEKEAFISWFVTAVEAIIQQRLLDVSNGEADELKSMILQAPERFRRLLINNPYIRCLLSLVKFELPEILEDKCELPGSVPTNKLVELLDLVKKHIASQSATFEDGKDAFYFFTTKDDYGYDDDIDYDGRHEYDDEERIAFETQGTSVAQTTYMDQLDKLDQLEALISSQPSSHPTGVARKKRKRIEKPSKESKKSRPGARGPRGPRDPSTAISALDITRSFKSSEYINDSDDDSDDDKDNAFFAREERLRRLLVESGGIVNATQLEEFKKVWLRLANDKGTDVEAAVNRAVENATENLRVAQEDSQTDFDSMPFTQSFPSEINSSQLLTQQDKEFENMNNSTQLSFSDSDQDDDNDSTLRGEDENKENQTPSSSDLSKRKQILFSDDEDEDSDTANVSYSSAKDVISRRRAVIEDEDDE